MKNFSFYFILGVLILPFFSLAQNTGLDQDLAALDKIESNSDYYKLAIQLNNKYLRKNEFESAMEFYELLIKKSKRRTNRSEQGIVLLDYAKSIVDCCNDIDNVIEFALKNLELSYEKSDKLGNLVLEQLHIINETTQDPVLLSKTYDLVFKISQDKSLVESMKNTNKPSLDRKSILAEKKRIEDAKSALEESKSDLENAKLNLELQMMDQKIVMTDLETDVSQQKEIAEARQKMLDSLKFESVIDSLDVAQKEEQIKQQAARIELQESQLALQIQQKKMMYVVLAFILIVMVLVGVMFYQNVKNNKQINVEKKKSDDLLLNILPHHIAQELKDNGVVIPKLIKTSTVMFTDFIGFSQIAKMMPPKDLLMDLNECYEAFDDLVEKYHVEKIKTIGDSYMCIANLTNQDDHSVGNVIDLGLAMQEFLTKWNAKRLKNNVPSLEARIGIHTGPLAAGIVGKKKFSYDVWGDTVNVASRIENQGERGKVNISESTYQLVKDEYEVEARGMIKIKNLPAINMYFVKSKKSTNR